MKKILFAIVAMAVTLTASAQFKGEIEVYKLDNFTIHSYKSFEAMADLSFIIEGKDGLVILEQQSFFQSMTDFNNYLATLNKPVVKVIANYHTGGLAEWKPEQIVMVEGMPEFEKGEMYGGMLSYFAQIFEGAMDLRPHGEVATVAFNSTQNWAGLNFKFLHGAKSARIHNRRGHRPIKSIILISPLHLPIWEVNSLTVLQLSMQRLPN